MKSEIAASSLPEQGNIYTAITSQEKGIAFLIFNGAPL